MHTRPAPRTRAPHNRALAAATERGASCAAQCPVLRQRLRRRKTIMLNFDFHNPTHIVFGQGRIADL
ncbi:MAG TPA: hypothetical protein PLY99_15220, partial [Acidovorax temperans]|nr:hypothetical protein [Acidovorax temperans]